MLLAHIGKARPFPQGAVGLVSGVRSAELITQPDTPVHLVQPRIAWYDKPIRLMEEPKCSSQVGSPTEPELRPDILIERKILV